jgi:hypothetical protein
MLAKRHLACGCLPKAPFGPYTPDQLALTRLVLLSFRVRCSDHAEEEEKVHKQPSCPKLSTHRVHWHVSVPQVEPYGLRRVSTFWLCNAASLPVQAVR